MSEFLQTELEASRFRAAIRAGVDPDIVVLCGVKFFGNRLTFAPTRLEPYVREFVPIMARAAEKIVAGSLLPSELTDLGKFSQYLSGFSSEVLSQTDRAALSTLTVSGEPILPVGEAAGGMVRCLLVDDLNPTLGLPRRGRMLNLRAAAWANPRRSKEDTVTVHNPVRQIDDSFLDQARISVEVARRYLSTEYQLPPSRRYRIEFTLDASNSQFTGESLGVAFALAAVAAIVKLEALRVTISVEQDAAVTGKLNADGSVEMIDGEGLRLKLERAWYSPLKAVAVPSEHLVEAVRQAQAFRGERRTRRFDLIGVSRFEDLMRNPNFVQTTPIPLLKLAGKRAWRAKRSLWVEIPALALLAFVMWLIARPPSGPPAKVEFREDGFVVLNHEDQALWEKRFPGVHLADARDQLNDLSNVSDLDGDSIPEVLVFLPMNEPGPLCGRLLVYKANGDTLFTRFCGIARQYPTDTVPEGGPDYYFAGRIRVVTVNGQLRVITELSKIEPARGYIRFWSATGDSLGWYINSGGTTFFHVADADHDGSDELLFFGFNLRLNCVAMFVLPADSVAGVGPPYGTNERGVDVSRVMRGNHEVYFAFPPTDIWLATGRQNYQGSLRIEVRPDELVAAAAEAQDALGGPEFVRYHISPQYDVRLVSLDDPIRHKRRVMIAQGLLADVSDSAYCEDLRSKVIRFPAR